MTPEQTSSGRSGGSKRMKTGAELIAAERKRQIDIEGWSAEHDDSTHPIGSLEAAAACYVLRQSKAWLCKRSIDTIIEEELWPWAWCWWKPKNDIQDLVRAGALIAAAIDLRLRAAAEAEKGQKK